jgi:hypothetical protein
VDFLAFQNRYYHRSLNPKKLIAVGFTQLKPKMTISMTIKLYKLPSVRFIPLPLIEFILNDNKKRVATYFFSF